jgi:hypothetical protein
MLSSGSQIVRVTSGSLSPIDPMGQTCALHCSVYKRGTDVILKCVMFSLLNLVVSIVLYQIRRPPQRRKKFPKKIPTYLTSVQSPTNMQRPSIFLGCLSTSSSIIIYLPSANEYSRLSYWTFSLEGDQFTFCFSGFLTCSPKTNYAEAMIAC